MELKDNSVQFSVVVPVYNIEEYLENCIKSLVTQSIRNFEIILVDDGSTDKSGIICDTYKEKYNNIKVIHKENGGLVSARKAGAELAKGNYIICVDGDDWVSECYLEHFNSIIKDFAPDIVLCSYVQVFPNHEVVHIINMNEGLYNREKIEKLIFPVLLSDVNGTVFEPTLWAKAIKRELYIRNQRKVSNTIKIGEDGACSIPCVIEADSLYISSHPQYFYRFNEKSMTKEKRPFNWNGISEIYNHFNKNVDLKQYDFSNQFKRRMIHSLFNVSYTQFYKSDSYIKISAEIKKQLNKKEYYEIINGKINNMNLKLYFAKLVLKCKAYFILKLYSCFK